MFIIANEFTGEPVDAWLEDYDPDACQGRGDASFTHDPDRAMRFIDTGAAIECWRAQSVTRPIRPDGKPNRPLTAFTITFKELP